MNTTIQFDKVIIPDSYANANPIATLRNRPWFVENLERVKCEGWRENDIITVLQHHDKFFVTDGFHVYYIYMVLAKEESSLSSDDGISKSITPLPVFNVRKASQCNITDDSMQVFVLKAIADAKQQKSFGYIHDGVADLVAWLQEVKSEVVKVDIDACNRSKIAEVIISTFATSKSSDQSNNRKKKQHWTRLLRLSECLTPDALRMTTLLEDTCVSKTCSTTC